ncbi:hypothetical protein HIM_10547 [Hirsutella minnesotensis 3608]|uniref:Cytochrome P450 n=1 Tax=Hirsutella minnesotensis 3608 TaxID=1043627 RepID=A0A0F8A263_9HYPO|nr:hypothetical protein HIM_10547 [Hirsutella minnesotensis 3608]
MAEVRIKMPRRIDEAKARTDARIESDHATVVQALLTSNLPPAEMSTARLSAEANVIIQAATETTASVLSVITYYLLANPNTYASVLSELSTIVTDPLNLPSWSALESLPYLNAVILEGLRMACPNDRFTRIAVNEDLHYRGTWTKQGGRTININMTVPRGYAVAISALAVHMNDSYFPNCAAFQPERWLDAQGQRTTLLEQYMIPFSKGGRACLGIQLAYCQLYVALAAAVMRVLPDMRIHENTEGDSEHRESGEDMPKKKSKGAKVVMV